MEGGKGAEWVPQGCAGWMQNIPPAAQAGLRVFGVGSGAPCIARHYINPLVPGWWTNGWIPGKGAPGVGG